jgi:hypothetical protein
MALVHIRNPNSPATVTNTKCVQLEYNPPRFDDDDADVVDDDEDEGYSKYQDCVDAILFDYIGYCREVSENDVCRNFEAFKEQMQKGV